MIFYTLKIVVSVFVVGMRNKRNKQKEALIGPFFKKYVPKSGNKDQDKASDNLR